MQKPFTVQDLIDLGEGVRRIVEDKDVQTVWEGLEEALFKQWKAAATHEDRESIWAKVSALGSLRVALQAAVDAGQAEAAKLEAANRPRSQH
jgi:hypothetical protein